MKSIVLFALVALSLLVGLSSCKQEKASDIKSDIERGNPDKDGFVKILDGKTLANWEGDPKYWRVENGCLVGEVTPETLLKNNSFIIWQGGQPADFELKLEYRISESGNSGINYRSTRIDTIPYALRGYQSDIDGKNKYTGQNYEEKKRTTLAYMGETVNINSQNNPYEPGSLRLNIEKNCWQSREVSGTLVALDSLKSKIKSDDWNEVHLVIEGNRLRHYVNGILLSDVTDNDTINRTFQGYIGVQVHVGPPMKVEYRNIRLKVL